MDMMKLVQEYNDKLKKIPMTFPACYLPYKFQVFALVSNSQKRTKTQAEPRKGNYIVRTEDLTMQTCTKRGYESIMILSRISITGQ